MFNSKTPLKVIVLILILSLALSACGGNNAPANNDAGNNNNAKDSNNNGSSAGGDDGGMDMELSGDFHLDPALLTEDDTASLEASAYLYEGLVRMDGGEIVPGIASSWKVSDDGLTYEFTLRPNAVFSDGTQVTADVVHANFYRWFDPANALHGDSAGYAAWQQYFLGFLGEYNEDGLPTSLFDGAEKVDSLTVLLHLNEPVDNLLEILSMPQFSMVSPSALAAGGFGMSADSVLGSGQYVIVDWSGDTLSLAPSDTYWGNQ